MVGSLSYAYDTLEVVHDLVCLSLSRMLQSSFYLVCQNPAFPIFCFSKNLFLQRLFNCGLLMSVVCLESSCPRLSHGWLLTIKDSAQISPVQRRILFVSSQVVPSPFLCYFVRIQIYAACYYFINNVPCIIVTCVGIDTIKVFFTEF